MPFGVPWRRRTSDRPGGPMMPMPRATWLAAVVVASLHSAESAFSEEPALVRPFLFSVSTAPSATSRWAVFTESAIGGGTSAPSAYDGLEQYLGVQGSLGHGLTLLGQFGMRDSGIAAAQGVQQGGARLFVGPALHVAPPGSKLQLSLVGGPMIHATRNNYSSNAPRALAGSKGYAARASLAYSF